MVAILKLRVILSKYFISMYTRYICTNMKFLWLNLWPGGASTDDNADNANINTRRLHTTHNSWSFRLFGIYAKWANNSSSTDVRDDISNGL